MSKIKTFKKFTNQVLMSEGMEIGNPIILEEISFIPILRNEVPKEERDYVSLEEALNGDLCKVIDKGNEVAHILFQNASNFPILIEEGEIFQGQGTQDRMSVGTIMVQPQSEVEVAVKCVHAPHHLSSGASFSHGGKASRGMLNELRSLKYTNAISEAPVSTINQNQIWNKVNEELNAEDSVSNKVEYMQGIEVRRMRSKKRNNELKFPDNTIGFVAIDAEGEIKGMEVHRTPHNFKIRKAGILESLETNISWKSIGKGPYKNSIDKVKEVFKRLSSLEEGKDILKQTEIDSLTINMSGIHGEVLTSSFYADVCPECGDSKPRKKICPNCGNEEEDSDEFAFMSLY